MPWVACPGDGGSVSFQDEKQSVLRLTQIRFTGLEITFSNMKTLQKIF